MTEIGGHLLNDYYTVVMGYKQKPVLRLKFKLGDKTYKMSS